MQVKIGMRKFWQSMTNIFQYVLYKMNTKINIHHIILCWGMFKRISIIFYVSIVIKAEWNIWGFNSIAILLWSLLLYISFNKIQKSEWQNILNFTLFCKICCFTILLHIYVYQTKITNHLLRYAILVWNSRIDFPAHFSIFPINCWLCVLCRQNELVLGIISYGSAGFSHRIWWWLMRTAPISR